MFPGETAQDEDSTVEMCLNSRQRQGPKFVKDHK